MLGERLADALCHPAMDLALECDLLITVPTSSTTTWRNTRVAPVSGSISTSQTWQHSPARA